MSKALDLAVTEMESKPFTDIFGDYYTEIASHSSKQSRGEYYTPSPICELMAKICINPQKVISKGEPLTVNEPCCGSGGMVLAIAKQFSPVILNGDKSYVDLLRFTCQDINPVGVDMCYINTTLWGIPATMICGDTIRMTVNNAWKNVHWGRVGEDQRLAAKHMLQIIKSPIPKEKQEAPKPDIILPPVEQRLDSGGQFEFNLGLGESEQITR